MDWGHERRRAGDHDTGDLGNHAGTRAVPRATPAENALALQLFILFAATPLLLLAVAIDDERRSKEALRVSEERMNLAAESAQLALWDWHLASDVVWVQDQGHFGFPPDAPVDHATLGGSVHPDDRALREAAIQRALANGGHYESEFRVILRDGTVRWIAARGRSPTAVDGKPERILGIAIDITRQKQAARRRSCNGRNWRTYPGWPR